MQTPGGLLVSEHVILVLASHVGVVGVLVEDETPWVIEATTLQVNTARRAGVTVVTVDLVAIGAHHEEIPVVEHHRSWLSLHSAELLQEGTSGAVVHKNTVGALAGHIEEGPCVCVVPQHTARLEVGDKHSWEEGEG